MKQKLIILIVLFVVATNANAQVTLSKCQSIFSNVQGIFNKSVTMYNDLRKDLAKLIFSDDLAKAAEICFDFQEDLYKLSGTAFGNGESSVGPRYVTIPCSNIAGSLVTDRTFISVPSGYDKLYITIEQTDGKSEADINVCVKDAQGLVVNNKEKNLDGIGKKAEFVFYGTENKYITIHLVKKISVNGFSYKLKITGEVNAEKEDIVAYLDDLKKEDANTVGTNPKPSALPIKPGGTTGTNMPKISKGDIPVKPTVFEPNNEAAIKPKLPIQPKPMPNTEVDRNAENIPSNNSPTAPKIVPNTNQRPKPIVPKVNNSEGTNETETDLVDETNGNKKKKRLKQQAKDANKERGGTPDGEDKESLKNKGKDKKAAKASANETEETKKEKKQEKKEIRKERKSKM